MVRSVSLGGKLLSFDTPKIMGIVNLTPDSFYTKGKQNSVEGALQIAEQMLNEGADILDLGGQSSRPGAEMVGAQEEIRRVVPALEAIKNRFPNAIISVDTFHSEVARAAVQAGALLVNDISAGILDKRMLQTISDLKVSYCIMHMQKRPENMQQNPLYDDVVLSVFNFLKERVAAASELGIKDLIVDLGFGFGKTVEQNYSLLKHLTFFELLEKPILVGVSRKSMIYKVLGIDAEEALNGTTALHIMSLERGANILRVHDVKEAKEAVTLFSRIRTAP